MKISDEQKKQMLEEVLQKHRSVTKVAKEYNVAINYFKRLLANARVHGIENVLHSNIKGSYPFEFKLEVVKFIELGGTFGEAATKFGLNYWLGRNWFLKYSKGGATALKEERRGRKPLKNKETVSGANTTECDVQKLRMQNYELKKKLRHLEMENEFLKKLDALVRERIERENKR